MNIKNEILNPTTGYGDRMKAAERWENVNFVCALAGIALGTMTLIAMWMGWI
ncbi:MAG: hypothetical protein HUK20_05885 [Fibrobacter sp.]|nr:hypothetical protein [Fibrobacter sp.]